MWQNRETNWRCGSLSENFIAFLKTPKIINTKQYIHPKSRQYWAMWQNRDNFGEQLSVATFGHSFRGPLCRIALGSRFGEQSSFREPIWRMSLGSSRFGATALQRCFGEQLWGAALGSSFGELFREHLWQTFRNNFEEQLLWRTAALGGSFRGRLYKQLCVLKAPRENNSNEERSEEGTGKD